MMNFHKLAQFLNQQEQSCVVITEGDLSLIRQSLKVLGLTKKILLYPGIGTFPYDPTPPSAVHAAERIKTVAHLKGEQTFCLLMPPLAWFEKRPLLDDMLGLSLPIHVNDTLTHRHLTDVLTLYSFQNSDTVTHPGQYAIRGDRVDLFPPNSAYPVRIDFFGDTIEAIKVFDPITQKSITTVPKVTLWPASEFLIDQSHIDCYRKNYASQLSEIDQEMVEGMIVQKSGKNWGHLWPLFYEISHHISYFWKDEPSIFVEPTIDMVKIWQDIQEVYARSHAQGRLVLPPEQLFTQIT
jgi:transcription-repair coupling factor (superfamily II helicase)